MAISASGVPTPLIEFFVPEAVEYAEALREIMWLPAANRDTGKMLAAARGMRGAATMVRLSDLAVVAGHMERIARALHTRRLQWTEPLSYSLQAVLYELPELISAASVWGPGESERAAAIASALHGFAPSDQRKKSNLVVPIARLFHSDSGPHVIYVAVTPQTQFEQQLREPPPDRVNGAQARAPRPPEKKVADFVPPPRRATPARAMPAPPEDRSTPRGQDLHSLLSEGLASMDGMDLAHAAPQAGVDSGLVPIQSLLYAGRSALARARQIRAAQAAASREPTPDELDELMDLMELATSS